VVTAFQKGENLKILFARRINFINIAFEEEVLINIKILKQKKQLQKRKRNRNRMDISAYYDVNIYLKSFNKRERHAKFYFRFYHQSERVRDSKNLS
jgi:hypothetical protein